MKKIFISFFAVTFPLVCFSQELIKQKVVPNPVLTKAAIDSAASDTLKYPTLPAMQGKKLVLSREECIKIALETSQTIKVADMEITRVDYSKKETLAALFPSIDFSAAYQRNIELQTMVMNLGGQTNKIKMGQDNNWNFGFSAAMPLIAPTLWKSINISDVQILQALESARASKLDLINNINKAYYALMLANASFDVLKQNYDVAVFNAQLYEKRFSQGTASEYDVLRSSVQVKNLEPELLQAQIAIRQCKLQLKILMGLTDAVDIEPNIALNNMQDKIYSYYPQIDSTLSGNSSLRSLDLQSKLLEETVSLKKRAWIPTLSLAFNVSWLSMSNGNAFRNMNFNPYSNVALALSVPIFSGGSKYYGLKQAQVQLNEMALQRETLVNSLNMQIELALDNIDKEIAQISSSKEGVRQAEKAYEIVQKSFEIGAATYLDLRDSETANSAAKLAYYQAIYNYLISTSELDLLVGKENDLIKNNIAK